MLLVRFRQWLLIGSVSAALGAGPADRTPCPSPGICPMTSSLAYPLPGSSTKAQHQQKGGRMLHPGWVSDLKVKARCEGPDPPGLGRPSIVITYPWSMDHQGVAEMETVCSAHPTPTLPITSSRERCQQKQPWVQHLQTCPRT